MDAYELSKHLFDYWRELAMQHPDAASVKKRWASVPVFVDGKEVVDIKIKDNKIVLETK